MEKNSVASDFLNPKSMLTPGFAGVLVMALANSVSSAIEFNPIYIALALSFLVGTLIFQSAKLEWSRGVYYILNSLIIFNMALGGNAVGVSVRDTEIANLTIVSTALAQPAGREQELLGEQRKVIEALRMAKDDGERDRLLGEIERISEEIADSKAPGHVGSQPSEDKTFFKPWKF